MKKAELRKIIKANKAGLTDAYKPQAAATVFEAIEQTQAFAESEHILIYSALPDELPTLPTIIRWSENKSLYLPRVNGCELDILPYNGTTLSQGAFNILEPQGNNTIDINIIDMIIVPGVAFDRNRNRLGRGKGFYDRLLQQTRAIKIGVCYDCQLVDEIETESHDIPMDIIVTPSTIISP